LGLTGFCSQLKGGKDAVGDGGGFDGGADIVDAEDVGSCEYGGCVGCGGSVETGFGGRRVPLVDDGLRWDLSEGVGEEALARGSDEKGETELVELVEVGEDRIVIVEALAEAETGVENELIVGNASGFCGFDASLQAGDDEGEDFVWSEWRETGPFVRAATGVHEDGSAAEGGAGGGHGRIPEVAADVVDDFGSGFDGVLGG